MTTIGTPLRENSTKLLLLGSGELGKEVAIEAQRFGIEVIAVDRYANAPAMQVAHRAYVIDMLDGQALREVILKEQPQYIVPEIEAIATTMLLELEQEGFNVIPSAKAAWLTMNRKGIRQLASEELNLPTSPYCFAATYDEYLHGIEKIGMPCVVKPIMSSSGKGQSIITERAEVDTAWKTAQEGGRAGEGEVIIEGFLAFDSEITLLTVSHQAGVSFCAPIGHRQLDGDYRESWQPHKMKEATLEKAETIGAAIANALGGFGVFGVELFIKDDEVYFSEVSPRPHDTGMVTMISQDLTEFALHVRAILGLPIPNIRLLGPSASCALVASGCSKQMSYHHIDQALTEQDTSLRLFGKPEMSGYRRLGVGLARADTVEQARAKAERAIKRVMIEF